MGFEGSESGFHHAVDGETERYAIGTKEEVKLVEETPTYTVEVS